VIVEHYAVNHSDWARASMRIYRAKLRAQRC